jgi:hydroxyethylthiazole kinase-like uncharacterized protein yjeF
MPLEVLTPQEMGRADRLTVEQGHASGFELMCRAGAAIVTEALGRFPQAAAFDVLCGPGNNGGDGYVAAALLQRAGAEVRVWAEGAPREGTEAAAAADKYPAGTLPLSEFSPAPGVLVIDALYGAGLSRPLEGAAARAATLCAEKAVPVLAVDLPSGISGESGTAPASAFRAALTVTFARLKPGHLLMPGRAACGEVVVADIGIPDMVIAEVGPACFENRPPLWRHLLPSPALDAHKYSRGSVGVLGGGPTTTGAARLAALAAARAGAGAVTLLSPGGALAVNAVHLTSIMLRRAEDGGELAVLLADRPANAYVLGPGFGVGEKAREFASLILGSASRPVLVLDADAITSFRENPQALAEAAAGQDTPRLVLTPHEGEFGRLFPDLADDATLSKLDRAREAARRSHAVVVYKGPDTVIASPDGRAALNANGTPWLATAGSGDVLAGMIAGLAGQGMPLFEAACATVWMHGEAGGRFGAGLIAEDIPGQLPEIYSELLVTPAP